MVRAASGELPRIYSSIYGLNYATACASLYVTSMLASMIYL
jgi:hypothetical protein